MPRHLTTSRTATAKTLKLSKTLYVGSTPDNGYGPQERAKPGDKQKLYHAGVHNEWVYGDYDYGVPGEKKFKTTPQTGNPSVEGGGGHENG